MKSTRCLVLILLMFTILAQGCENYVCEKTPLPADASLNHCDITKEQCQCYVYKWVSAQRDATKLLTPPVTRTISRQEYIDSQPSSNGNNNGEANAFGESLRLLGYNDSDESFSEDENQLLGGAVGAFYSRIGKDVTIIAGPNMDPSSTISVILLAHEYVHAQQDSEGFFDYITSRLYAHEDVLAGRAAIEGEAELIETFAYLSLKGQERKFENLQSAFEEQVDTVIENALTLETPFLYADLLFPYPFGAHMYTNAYFGKTGESRTCKFAKDEEQGGHFNDPEVTDSHGGNYRNIREMRCQFPVRTWQYLEELIDLKEFAVSDPSHPIHKGYSSEARIEALTNRISPAYSLPDLPEEYTQRHPPRDMGAWHLSIYMAFAYPDYDNFSFVFDNIFHSFFLGGDRLIGVENSDGDNIVGWWWKFRNEDAAESFYCGLTDAFDQSPSPPGTSREHILTQNGTSVLFTVSSDSGSATTFHNDWMTTLPAHYASYEEELNNKTTLKATASDGDRPQLPTRIY